MAKAKIDPELLKKLSYSRTDAALQRGTHALTKEHAKDNYDQLPQGVRDSIEVKNAILLSLNKGLLDNSVKSMRVKYSIDGKALDRKRAIELREERKVIFDLNRRHKKR